jgi:hypothetical protein
MVSGPAERSASHVRANVYLFDVQCPDHGFQVGNFGAHVDFLHLGKILRHQEGLS